MPENAANKNENPGDLKQAGQANSTGTSPAGFAEFPTAQDGYAALLNDVQSSINKKPNETLEQFSATYAPEDDGNDPMQYAANLANQTGTTPTTAIGTLQPDIGKLADAIANNEGYKPSQQSGVSGVGSQVGGALIAGAPLVGAGIAASIPEDIEAGVGDLVSGAKNWLGGLFGGSSSNASSSSTTDSSPLGASPAPVNIPNTPAPVEPSQSGGIIQPPATSINTVAPSNESPQQPQENQSEESPASLFPVDTSSQTYNDIQNGLKSTVSGNNVLQEGENRGTPATAVLSQPAIASVLNELDENGNYNRVGAYKVASDLISQDKDSQRKMVNTMTTPTNLQDMRKSAHAEVDSKMADTGERLPAHREVDRIFDDYFSELPKAIGTNGQPYIKSFSLLPNRLQKKKELLSVSQRDFAKPAHERAAAAHVKEAMRKRLSEIAKKEGVKGWDETNKRMEGNILGKKAIKALPKKAPRDKNKELLHDIVGGLGGALIGKTLGNGILGSAAGYVVANRLGKKHYKNLGSRKEQEEAKKNKSKPLQGLLAKRPEHTSTTNK